MTQISPSAPSPGRKKTNSPNSIDSRPDSPSSHFALDLPPQPNRRDDLEDSHQERPRADEYDEQERRHPWPQEGHNAGGDAEQADDQQRPERLALVADLEGSN